MPRGQLWKAREVASSLSSGNATGLQIRPSRPHARPARWRWFLIARSSGASRCLRPVLCPGTADLSPQPLWHRGAKGYGRRPTVPRPHRIRRRCHHRRLFWRWVFHARSALRDSSRRSRRPRPQAPRRRCRAGGPRDCASFARTCSVWLGCNSRHSQAARPASIDRQFGAGLTAGSTWPAKRPCSGDASRTSPTRYGEHRAFQ